MNKTYKMNKIEIEIWAGVSLQDAQRDAICLAVYNNCIVSFEFNGVYHSFNAPSLVSTGYTEEINDKETT